MDWSNEPVFLPHAHFYWPHSGLRGQNRKSEILKSFESILILDDMISCPAPCGRNGLLKLKTFSTPGYKKVDLILFISQLTCEMISPKQAENLSQISLAQR